MSELEKDVEKIANMASNFGLNLKQLIECLNESVGVSSDTGAGQKEGPGVPNLDDDETKVDPGNDLLHLTASVDDVKLRREEAQLALEEMSNLNINQSEVDAYGNVPGEVLTGTLLDFDAPNTTPSHLQTDRYNNEDQDDLYGLFGGQQFGKKIVSKATESVRQIAKKKGIYIVGRKGKKFLGIRFTKKGNYGKNKKGRPNGKMYTYDGLKKMTNKRVSFKKLPELIDMMNTKAVLKKYKNFKFGFELERQPRGCSGFGYTFPVGAGYGKRSALLYGKL